MSDAIREAFEHWFDKEFDPEISLTMEDKQMCFEAWQAAAPQPDHFPDAGKVEPIGYLTNQAVARLQSDKRLNGEHLYAFKPDDMSKFQAVYLGPTVKNSLTAEPHQAESLAQLDSEDQKGMERIVDAVAHIGIDFGYGTYELEQCHIDRAREIKESLARLRASQQEGG